MYVSVVVLAAEILKRMKPFIEDGVHPQLLIRAITKASEEVGILAVFFFFWRYSNGFFRL